MTDKSNKLQNQPSDAAAFGGSMAAQRTAAVAHEADGNDKNIIGELKHRNVSSGGATTHE